MTNTQTPAQTVRFRMLESAFMSVKRHAKLMHDSSNGHEVIALDPAMWRELCSKFEYLLSAQAQPTQTQESIGIVRIFNEGGSGEFHSVEWKHGWPAAGTELHALPIAQQTQTVQEHKHTLKVRDPSAEEGWRTLYGSKEDCDAVNSIIDESFKVQPAQELSDADILNALRDANVSFEDYDEVKRCIKTFRSLLTGKKP